MASPQPSWTSRSSRPATGAHSASRPPGTAPCPPPAEQAEEEASEAPPAPVDGAPIPLPPVGVQAPGARPLSRRGGRLAARPARGRRRAAPDRPGERRLLLDLRRDHGLLRLVRRQRRLDRDHRLRGEDRRNGHVHLDRGRAAGAGHDPARDGRAGPEAGDDPVPDAAVDPRGELPLQLRLALLPHRPVGAGLGGRRRPVRLLRHRLASAAGGQPGANPDGLEGVRRGGHRAAGGRYAERDPGVGGGPRGCRRAGATASSTTR